MLTCPAFISHTYFTYSQPIISGVFKWIVAWRLPASGPGRRCDGSGQCVERPHRYRRDKHISQQHLRWEDLLSLAAPVWDVSVYQSLLGRCWCLLTGKSESVSHWGVSDSLPSHGLQPTRFLCPWDSPGKNTGVSCHSLLQGIFPTKRSNLSLLNCRQSLPSKPPKRAEWMLWSSSR